MDPKRTSSGHREGQRQSREQYGVGSELGPEPFPETAEAPEMEIMKLPYRVLLASLPSRSRSRARDGVGE